MHISASILSIPIQVQKRLRPVQHQSSDCIRRWSCVDAVPGRYKKQKKKRDATYPNRTSDLRITSATPYHLAKEAVLLLMTILLENRYIFLFSESSLARRNALRALVPSGLVEHLCLVIHSGTHAATHTARTIKRWQPKPMIH